MSKVGWLRLPLAVTYAFLYIPIVVLVIMSFNASKTPFVWTGFSTKWYGELLNNELIREGFINTMIVAVSATILATALGTMLAIGIARYFRSAIVEAYSLAPAIIPDLALAIGLLALFSLIGVSLSLVSVLLSHVVFGMAFVAAVVIARLGQTDSSLEEASRDLGASAVSTFFRITLPSIAPAIIAGALLVFTLSLDEFVVAYFTDGPTTPTLPIVIYSMVRFGVTPEINALAALLLLVSFTIVLSAQRITRLTDSV
ncbi:MAG: ABC transporter permease [Candidatus Nanopelagicales bacterium]|nr:ABC transporter permease [Candidatus Nanopelagicales bacterium]MCF8537198.1 ABC transporter permease [Candidatus Nanopelagicales bacterium]MCF8542138.1 ABC transporter permease [Candidatus Nanopelagicales bacterium]MCF8556429.1 ABC transporter permease [Candidatus Nanopelagicales bacterium]